MPLIVANEVPQTRSVHLLVIWDAWHEISSSDRSSIIMDAYGVAVPNSNLRVSVTMGVTAREALSMGYLPYRVVPMVRKQDKVRAADVLSAMQSVGGIYIKAGPEVQLRFPTQGQAQDAYRRLSEMIRLPIWTLVHELAAAESA